MNLNYFSPSEIMKTIYYILSKIDHLLFIENNTLTFTLSELISIYSNYFNDQERKNSDKNINEETVDQKKNLLNINLKSLKKIIYGVAKTSCSSKVSQDWVNPLSLLMSEFFILFYSFNNDDNNDNNYYSNIQQKIREENIIFRRNFTNIRKYSNLFVKFQNDRKFSLFSPSLNTNNFEKLFNKNFNLISILEGYFLEGIISHSPSSLINLDENDVKLTQTKIILIKDDIKQQNQLIAMKNILFILSYIEKEISKQEKITFLLVCSNYFSAIFQSTKTNENIHKHIYDHIVIMKLNDQKYLQDYSNQLKLPIFNIFEPMLINNVDDFHFIPSNIVNLYYYFSKTLNESLSCFIYLPNNYDDINIHSQMNYITIMMNHQSIHFLDQLDLSTRIIIKLIFQLIKKSNENEKCLVIGGGCFETHLSFLLKPLMRNLPLFVSCNFL